MSDKTRFAGYPSAVVYEGSNKDKPVQHLLWGDWLKLKNGKEGPFCEVHARGVERQDKTMVRTLRP